MISERPAFCPHRTPPDTPIQIRPVHPTHPQPRVVAEAASVLDAGGVVALPTDTVYGLVCDPANRRAVETLYRVRRLDEHKLLALLCDGLAEVARYAVVDDYAYRMLRKLLPGPYCMVLPAGREAPRLLLKGKRKQVGVRIPDSEVCRAVLRQLGRPVCVTSAVPPPERLRRQGRAVADEDEEGEEPPVCQEADEIARVFPEVDLVLDAGPLGNVPSTVVEVEEGAIAVLREGKGALEELE